MATFTHHPTLILNARTWTAPWPRPSKLAVFVRDGRIAAVGTEPELRHSLPSSTLVIDAAGRFLMPGFCDAHIHLMGGGAQLESVALKDAATPDEFARRLASRAAELKETGGWVTGGEWDEQRWPEPTLPTRQLIDAVTGDVPVFVIRYDWHMALANTRTLQLARITRDTVDPPGGAIVRDANGEPTGVLKDAAMALVNRVMPPQPRARRAETLRKALAHMAALGVTSVQDMGPAGEDVDLYGSFAQEGSLTCRLRAVPLETKAAAKLATRPRAVGQPGDETAPGLTISGAKGFADGSLGSSTAFFFEPYADGPGTCGLLSDEMQPLEAMRSRLIALDAAGTQLCIHAIGDRAIAIVLDLFEDVRRANGTRGRRLRIEHSQHVAAGDFARYRDLGVIASVQPYHAVDDGQWAERRIGAARLHEAFPLRAFPAHGIRTAFGTDWPVAPLDPWRTVCAAVTRATLDGKHPDGWLPEQRVTVAEALTSYTLGSAYAEFAEDEKGTIEVGKLADLILVDRDPFDVEPAALADLQVDMTMVGGRVVYERRR